MLNHADFPHASCLPLVFLIRLKIPISHSLISSAFIQIKKQNKTPTILSARGHLVRLLIVQQLGLIWPQGHPVAPQIRLIRSGSLIKDRVSFSITRSPVSSLLIIILISCTRAVSLQQWAAVKTSKFAPAVIALLPPSTPSPPFISSNCFPHLSSLLSSLPPPPLALRIFFHPHLKRVGNFHHHHQRCNCCHHGHSIYFSPSSRGPYIKHSASSLQ